MEEEKGAAAASDEYGAAAEAAYDVWFACDVVTSAYSESTYRKSSSDPPLGGT